LLIVAPEVQGIDLFKIANRSISGWIPSLKTGTTVKQPFCNQLEERLLLWLEYHPQVVNYARGDIDPQFATKYRLPIPKHAPFAIGYTFEDKPHHYVPDIVGTLSNGQPFIAEAGMEDDKRGDRNLAKAEAARRLTRLQQGVFWIGTERTLTKFRHYNLVFLHARRKTFPAFGGTAAQAGGMTLEELERCFYQAIVDDYQQAFDGLRRQRPCVLWEQAAAQSGVPQYLGSPDDLKLLLMKAQNRKTPHHGYRVQNGNRLSFQGRWYVCPGLLSRLRGREFDLYYDRRDVGVLYIFVEGEYVGEAYCPQLMGGRESRVGSRSLRTEIRASEQARQWDRQRQEIHPATVFEQLAGIEAKKLTPPKLPPAVPDADPDRPVRVLPIRTLRKEPQP
jgi:hypothetical protein